MKVVRYLLVEKIWKLRMLVILHKTSVTIDLDFGMFIHISRIWICVLVKHDFGLNMLDLPSLILLLCTWDLLQNPALRIKQNVRSISVGEENEAFFIRVWKSLPNRRIVKILRGIPKGKAQRGQYVLAVGLGCYKLY